MQIIKINGRPPKSYEILESGILITTFTNPKLPTEEQIPFENIKSDRFFYVHKSPIFLIAAGIFMLIYMFSLVDTIKSEKSYPIIAHGWGVFAICLIISYFLVQRKIFFIKTFSGRFIKFRVNKNDSEIAVFVKNVIEKRNEYLKLKYGEPSLYLSYDGQYSNFSIMLKEKILTTQEYQEKIKELNALFQQTSPQKIYPGYSQN